MLGDKAEKGGAAARGHLEVTLGGTVDATLGVVGASGEPRGGAPGVDVRDGHCRGRGPGVTTRPA